MHRGTYGVYIEALVAKRRKWFKLKNSVKQKRKRQQAPSFHPLKDSISIGLRLNVPSSKANKSKYCKHRCHKG